MRPVEPIRTSHLFFPLHQELLALLRRLTPAEWELPTAAAGWSVRDMAAHLLDTDLRRLSFQRDGLAPIAPPAPIATYRDLVDFLDQLNAQWVTAARRLSPRVLIDLHGLIGPQVAELFASLDPSASATGVAWAGEERSAVWFDVAREYTEKWMHQQQIRDALGAAPLTDRRWLHPALDTFVRGLPHVFRTLPGAPGAAVTLVVAGQPGIHGRCSGRPPAGSSPPARRARHRRRSRSIKTSPGGCSPGGSRRRRRGERPRSQVSRRSPRACWTSSPLWPDSTRKEEA